MAAKTAAKSKAKGDPAVEAVKATSAAVQQAIQEMVDETRKTVKTVVQDATDAVLQGSADTGTERLRPEARPHAFVVMPFGTKKGADGSLYNFNAIYRDLIKPALEQAGFEAFRADEENTSGDILTDMFQELLLADMCLCDLSIDNANVFYEVGIRHAFRKRGVVHIQAGRAYMPFDIFNVRTLPYHITDKGVPDPEYLAKDIQTIARFVHDTWASDRDAVHSPIFNLLDGLEEPSRDALRTPLATGYWRAYTEWQERMDLAQRSKRVGDILLLAEEVTNPLLKEGALEQAGTALKGLGHHELALKQYRQGLEFNPDNQVFRREEVLSLNRLNKVDDAIVKAEALIADFPNDGESIAYLGRIYKQMWVDSWKHIDAPEQRLRAAFDSYHWLVKAIDTYMHGYRVDMNNTYPGINALTLAEMLVHLADRFGDATHPDPDIVAVRELLPELRGTLEFALETRAADERADYWTLVSLAEFRVLNAETVQQVARAYRKALTASRRTIFFLESSISQLEMLVSLDMRPEFVQEGLHILRDELGRINEVKGADAPSYDKGAERGDPGRIILFTGYAVDSPREHGQHFIPAIEADVRKAILAKLDELKIGPNDRAVTAGMGCGSELLFIECCVERGIPVDAHMPVPEAAYVREFVSPGGESWVTRYYDMRNHPLVDEHYQLDRVGPPPKGDDLYLRNNRWALYNSLMCGVDRVWLIALWDGKTSGSSDRDARLVKHMVELMRETGGRIETINPAKFMPPPAAKKKPAAKAKKPAAAKK